MTRLLTVLALALWVSAQVLAATPSELIGGSETESARALLDGIESEVLDTQTVIQPERISLAIRQVTSLRTRGSQCVTGLQPELDRVKQSLAAVGETDAKEEEPKPERSGSSVVVSDQIEAMRQERATLESRIAECKLMALRADDVVARLTALQSRLLKQRLVHRDADIQSLFVRTLSAPDEVWGAVTRFLFHGTLLKQLRRVELGYLAVAGLVGLIIGLWSRNALRRQVQKLNDEAFPSRLARAAISSLARQATALGCVAALALLLHVQFSAVAPTPFALLLAYGLCTYLVAIVGIRTALWPSLPARQVTALADELARAFARRLTVLALLSLLGFLSLGTLLSQSFPDYLVALVRAVVVVLVTVNLAWLIWLVGKVDRLRRAGRGLRLLLLIALAGILAAELSGFRNLSAYLLFGLLGTAAAILVFWGLETMVGETFYGLDQGRYRWHRAIRRSLSLGDDESIPGLLWMRLLSALLIWVFFGLVLLRLWGLSDAGVALVVEYMVDGFQIGDTRIVPSKVIAGLFLFGLLLAGLRWFRKMLQERWLQRTRLHAGARETLIAITGYTGFAIAVLGGLSLAGVGLQNLAIIAGALSVGIGFGLQNIVSNFVSGIILLFERPVRPGDWVMVGGTEGYVRKVSVRSTEIRTFDRSDVIVPNSEFISTQVTNWTLRDQMGRVILPIGVAYGTDVERVRGLLLDIAQKDPRIVRSGVVPEPKVLFRSFGDSALLLELRCFILDINDKLDVVSDLNFAIDKVFRECGIEIPFPQRDLHLRSGSGEGWPSESDRPTSP